MPERNKEQREDEERQEEGRDGGWLVISVTSRGTPKLCGTDSSLDSSGSTFRCSACGRRGCTGPTLHYITGRRSEGEQSDEIEINGIPKREGEREEGGACLGDSRHRGSCTSRNNRRKGVCRCHNCRPQLPTSSPPPPSSFSSQGRQRSRIRRGMRERGGPHFLRVMESLVMASTSTSSSQRKKRKKRMKLKFCFIILHSSISKHQQERREGGTVVDVGCKTLLRVLSAQDPAMGGIERKETADETDVSFDAL